MNNPVQSQQVFLLSSPMFPDPVSMALGDSSQHGLQAVELPVGASLVTSLAALKEAAAPDCGFVGVGLVGTLLLGLAALCRPDSGVRVLALFPYLGVDTTVYGVNDVATTWANRWLALGRMRLTRSLMDRVAVSPAPLGLDHVYAPGSLSWAKAAAAMDKVDFVSLIMPVRCPTTVVLNLAAERLDLERARVMMPALNDEVQLAAFDPRSESLAARVQAWAIGGSFENAQALRAA
jgi:hypothetical protein